MVCKLTRETTNTPHPRTKVPWHPGMMGFRAARRVWQNTLVLQIFTLCLTVGLTVFVSAPLHAAAQAPQQNALARTLFEEGVALADQGDYVGAADRFSRAYSLKPTSGIAFNWASVLIENGKFLLAEDLLLGVQRDPAASASLKQESQTMLGALKPRLARLKVRVVSRAGAPVEPAISVEVDGQDWPRAAWDISSPIDPGAHTVRLVRGQSELARVEPQLAEGAAREVLLEVPTDSATPSDVATETTRNVDPPSERKPLYKSWVVWTAVGAVVVAGVVTGVVLATRKEPKDEAPIGGNTMPGVLRW
jgi:hypothetical protein